MKPRNPLVPLAAIATLMALFAHCTGGSRTAAVTTAGNLLAENAPALGNVDTWGIDCSGSAPELSAAGDFQYGSSDACLAEAVSSAIPYIKRTLSIDKIVAAGGFDGGVVPWRNVRGPDAILRSPSRSTLFTLNIRLQV